MRRTISESEALALTELLNEWSDARSMQESCVIDVRKLLDCSEDEALDLLNGEDPIQDIGLEVYDDEPTDQKKIAAMMYDPIPPRWEMITVIVSVIAVTVVVALWVAK